MFENQTWSFLTYVYHYAKFGFACVKISEVTRGDDLPRSERVFKIPVQIGLRSTRTEINDVITKKQCENSDFHESRQVIYWWKGNDQKFQKCTFRCN